MKQILAAILLAFSVSSFAEVSECNESYSVVPCRLSFADAKMSLVDMMLHNKEGMELIHRSGTVGLMLDFLSDEESLVVTVKSLKEEEQEYLTITTIVKDYEVRLLDCRGTDSCMGRYLWKVTETSTGDGYVSETKFENTLMQIQRHH